MRKHLSFVLAALLIVSSMPVSAESFRDTSGTIYDESFSALQERGVIQGYNDGTARPYALLNRVEALKVILESKGTYVDRIAWHRKNMPAIALFSDIDQTQWYGPYLEVAFQESIVTGYPNGTFLPARALTVEEAVTMLLRTYDEGGQSDRAVLSNYIENRENAWFTSYVNAAINKNLVMHSGKLRLGAPITRGQFFDMVYRLQEVRSQSILAYDGEEPEQSIPSGHTTGVTQQENDDDDAVTVAPQPRPQPVAPVVQLPPVLSKIDHPYASEKFFSITMPSLGVTDLTITHPIDPLSNDGVMEPLNLGVGHLFSYPGGGGKIMVYGHSSGYPWDVSQYTKIFRKVNQLEPGDKIYVTYSGKLYIYQVTHEQTILAKDTTPFQDNGSGEELILYTCWPPDSIQQRYLVHAVPVETIAAK